MQQQCDLLIQEIEGIDDYLGPTFRYVEKNFCNSILRLIFKIAVISTTLLRRCNNIFQPFTCVCVDLFDFNQYTWRIYARVVKGLTH